MSAWIGVDMDRTLCKYNGIGAGLGEPIVPMVDLVKQLLDEGYTIKIFTARVAPESMKHFGDTYLNQCNMIHNWCLEVFNQTFEITCVKDHWCVCIIDDRAVGVKDGKLLSPLHIWEVDE